jgi:acyl-CoA synthetase (NDP forming)/GNAT superfamily N-acetyltransferase
MHDPLNLSGDECREVIASPVATVVGEIEVPAREARVSKAQGWDRSAQTGSDVLLADGTVGRIRPITSGDRREVAHLHEGLSPESSGLRFFSVSRAAASRYVDHVMASCDGGGVLALGLWRHDLLVGVATAETSDAETAEIAFLVSDEAHGLGIATLLLEHLAAAARIVGIPRFTAEVLADNAPMLQVMRDAGFTVTHRSEQGVVTIEMDTSDTPEAVAAADRRDSISESASLEPLLSPGRVAVVGVRRDGTGVGAAILEAILDGGFTGEVVVVHPGGDISRRVRTVTGFDELDPPPDLVVVAVPPAHVVDTIASAGRCGARAAVVVTSGFAEMGADGAVLQRELTRVARSHDLRVVGPNCLGLLDNQAGVHLDATFGGAPPPEGGLAVASQSGGVGIVLLDTARRIGLGVRHFVSLGNKADVSSNDLLAAWLDEPGVTAGALYLESFGNSAKFARIARRFSERKPLLAVAGGRSGGGQRAGASHTAAAATPAVRVDALFAQAGVIGCSDADDLAQTALLLEGQPLPAGNRVAVLGNAGGMGVLAADALEVDGLDVPAFSEGLRTRLTAHVDATLGTSNPIDVGAAGSPETIGHTLDVLLASDEVDAVLCVLVRTRTMDWNGALDSVAAARARHPEKTVIGVLLGDDHDRALPGVTLLPTVPSAVRSLRHATRYADWRRQPRDPKPLAEYARSAASRDRAQAHLSSAGPGWLGLRECRTLVAPYGVVPLGIVVAGASAAARAACDLGFPVALKVADPRIVHKTERGLVRAGLSTAEEVEAAVREMAHVTGTKQVEILVQPMVAGVEVALGVVRDPGLGSLVRVAAGGVATEIWDDQRLLIAPVTRADVLSALRSLRIWPLLAGFRGQPAADTDALVDLVVGVGLLAYEVPELVEMDLNPVLVNPDGCELVDVKIRIAEAGAWDSGVPRRLRPPATVTGG